MLLPSHILPAPREGAQPNSKLLLAEYGTRRFFLRLHLYVAGIDRVFHNDQNVGGIR
jgi:hypothetical protein